MRIGLLGASKIAAEAVIQPAAVIPRVEITAIAARDPARAERFAAAHQISRSYPSYEALLAADEVDLVYCALPISHHAYWSIRALEAGKHVLCEKPFAMNRSEAERVLAAAVANDRRVVEAFHYRHHPSFQTCLDWIAQGRIGSVRSIDATFCVPIPVDGVDIRSLPELGGGAMMDLGCYPVHWVESVLGGPPEQVSATGVLTRTGVDEHIRAQLGYSGGIEARIYAAMGKQAQLSARLRVEGTEGSIDFVNPLAPHRGAELECRNGDASKTATISPISTYTYQLGDVVSALEQGTPLTNEGERILSQQTTLDRIYGAAGFELLRRSTYPNTEAFGS